MEVEYHITCRGKAKEICEIDKEGYVIKKFKVSNDKIPSIEEQRNIIETKIKYLGSYIPETILVEDGPTYYIKQKFIRGKTLSETNISNLSPKTLNNLINLINKYLKYHKETGRDIDVTGFQYYPNTHNELLRRIKSFLSIKQNFLASTNIMIGDDGNVYLVDVCEIIDNRLSYPIKNFFMKPFINITISKLKEALQEKSRLESA